MILTVTVLLSLLEFLDEVIARLLTAWGAVRTQNILISHCTVCVIPTYRQAKPLPLPESNLYHTFFSSQNTTNLQDPVHPQPLGNGGATDLQPLGNGGTTDLQPLGNGGATDLQPLGDGGTTDLQPLGDIQDTADLQLLSPYLCTATPTAIYTDLPTLLNYIKVSTYFAF